MLKLKSMLTEIILSTHFKERLKKRFYETSSHMLVLFRYKDDNNELHEDIVGSYSIPQDIRKKIKADIQALEYLNMDDNGKYGIVVWVFKILPNDPNLTYTTLEDRKKCLDEYGKKPSNQLYFGFEQDDGSISYGDALFLIVEDNRIKTGYFKPHKKILYNHRESVTDFKEIFFIKDFLRIKMTPKGVEPKPDSG